MVRDKKLQSVFVDATSVYNQNLHIGGLDADQLENLGFVPVFSLRLNQIV